MKTRRPLATRALFGVLLGLLACTPPPRLFCGIVNHRNAPLEVVVRNVHAGCSEDAPMIDPAKLTRADFGEPQTFELGPESRADAAAYPDSHGCVFDMAWITLGADFDALVVWHGAITIKGKERIIDTRIMRHSVVVEGTDDKTRVTVGDALDVLPPPPEGGRTLPPAEG
jgi:hypothetical protein